MDVETKGVTGVKGGFFKKGFSDDTVRQQPLNGGKTKIRERDTHNMMVSQW
jgi:hypothetical protein